MKDSSHFRMISIGTVAADKNDGSKFISVFPRELLPFHEGDITDDHVLITRTGTDADGNTYNINLQRGMAVKAEWLGNGNRVSAPSIRKGQQVKLYQVGDTPVYYWEEFGRDNHLRRSEAVTHTWNADSTGNEEDVAPTAKNSYTATVDTKNGHITVTTSMANGEKASYVLQIHGKQGAATLSDHLGNLIQLNSADAIITAKNQFGTYATLNKKAAAIYADDTVTAANKSKTFVALDGGSLTVNAPDSINLKAPSVVIEGDVTLQGSATITKDLNIVGTTTGHTGNFTSGTASDPH